MKQLLDQQMISGLEVSQSDNTFTCDACIQAKIAQVPFPKESREHAKKMGDRIYSDIWGLSRLQTIDNAFQKYKLYEAMLAHQRGIQIKILITDRGGEYTSAEFNKYLDNQGTNHRLTVHDTPESNGVAE